MKSFLTTEEHALLSQDFQSEYESSGDGFGLKVESTDGRLLEDASKLRSALSKERDSVKELKRKVKTFGELDPVAAQAALDAVNKWGEDPENKNAQALEAQRTELSQKHTRELTARDERVSTLTKQMENILLRERATAALAANEGNVTLLLPHVLSSLSMVEEDGQFSARVNNSDGSARVTQKEGSTEPMGVEEFVTLMRNNDDFQSGFKGSGASGGGTQDRGNQRSGGVLKISRSDDAAISANIQKIADGTAIIVD